MSNATEVQKAVFKLRKAKYRGEANPTWAETAKLLSELSGVDGTKLLRKLYSSDKNLSELTCVRDLTKEEWESLLTTKKPWYYLLERVFPK